MRRRAFHLTTQRRVGAQSVPLGRRSPAACAARRLESTPRSPGAPPSGSRWRGSRWRGSRW